MPKRILRERLYTDTHVCVVKREHTRHAIDLDTCVATPHTLMTLAADDHGIVNEALAPQHRYEVNDFP